MLGYKLLTALSSVILKPYPLNSYTCTLWQFGNKNNITTWPSVWLLVKLDTTRKKSRVALTDAPLLLYFSSLSLWHALYLIKEYLISEGSSLTVYSFRLWLTLHSIWLCFGWWTFEYVQSGPIIVNITFMTAEAIKDIFWPWPYSIAIYSTQAHGWTTMTLVSQYKVFSRRTPSCRDDIQMIMVCDYNLAMGIELFPIPYLPPFGSFSLAFIFVVPSS